MKKANKTMLVILDGWGIGQKPEADAIAQAQTPFVDDLWRQYPHSELITYGEEVGLPEGQMGNSEVGHLNIGAGRVVYQELARINKAIRDKALHQNPVLLKALSYAKQNGKPLHLMGLLSDGGVHSHINHLKALCDIAHEAGVGKVFIHAFMDGRDTDPKSGIAYVQELQAHIEHTNARLATLVGRYFSMDRDNRWDRIKVAYDLLVHGVGTFSDEVLLTMAARYEAGETDEFLKPIVLVKDAQIKNGDAVLFFNFRTDRPREISAVLTQQDMPEFEMQKLDLHYVTMTRYDETFKNIEVLFTKDDVSNTLGEVLSKAGKKQVRIAETEKYPHVTFFFNGGREEAFEGEERILVPSPKVATYDLQPQMSAFEITDAIINHIAQYQPDFICLNYANADMVGHTGVMTAAIKAVETVDQCVKRLVEIGLKYDYHMLIIADHGNSDYIINEDGTPNTAHTKNPVPCIYVANEYKNIQLKNGKLADVAPTILNILGIPASPEMDGELLFA